MPERKKYALIIGNSEYKKDGLDNPCNDAHDLAKALEQIGFEIDDNDVCCNLTRDEIQRKIDAFCLKIQGHTSLFYFAGHGFQFQQNEDDNYVMPTDSSDGNSYLAMSAYTIMRQLRESGSVLRIMIFDACRSSLTSQPFTDKKRHMIHNGWEDIRADEGEIIAYSTASGKVAYDGYGQGGNNPYMKCLQKHIVKTDLHLRDIFARTREEVRDITQGRQCPEERVGLKKDIYLYPENDNANILEGSLFQSDSSPLEEDIKELKKIIENFFKIKPQNKQEIQRILAQAEKKYSFKRYNGNEVVNYNNVNNKQKEVNKSIDAEFFDTLEFLESAKSKEVCFFIGILAKLLENSDNRRYALSLQKWLEDMQKKYNVDGIKIQNEVNSRLGYIQDCESWILQFVVTHSRINEHKYDVITIYQNREYQETNSTVEQNSQQQEEKNLQLQEIFEEINNKVTEKYNEVAQYNTRIKLKAEIFLPRASLNYTSKYRKEMEQSYPVVYRCLERNYPWRSQEFENGLVLNEKKAKAFLEKYKGKLLSWQEHWKALEESVSQLQKKPEKYIMWGCTTSLADLHDNIDMVLADADNLECIFATTKYLEMWQNNGEESFNVLQKIEDTHTCLMLWNTGKEDIELKTEQIAGKLIGNIGFIGQIALNMQNAKRAIKHYRPLCLILENPYTIPMIETL